jgi:drug/metabolite transporter (DMT)-like permease
MALFKMAASRQPAASPLLPRGMLAGSANGTWLAAVGGNRTRRTHGIVLVALAAVSWSTAGLFVRWLPLDMWTIAFWRGLFAAVFLTAATCAMARSSSWQGAWRIGLPELAVAACAATSILAFIPALQMTSVANVAVIYSTVPVLTALMASVFLAEAFQRAMIPSGLLIAAGTSLVVWGNGFGSDLLGNLLAGLMTLTMAGVGVLIRGFRDRPLLRPICLANVAVALVALPLATPLVVSGVDMLVLIPFALIQVALAFVLFVLGAPKIPASEAALIGTIEAPLAPLWVLVAFGEVPSLATIAGGTMILCATIAYLRRAPAPRPTRSIRLALPPSAEQQPTA